MKYHEAEAAEEAWTLLGKGQIVYGSQTEVNSDPFIYTGIATLWYNDTNTSSTEGNAQMPDEPSMSQLLTDDLIATISAGSCDEYIDAVLRAVTDRRMRLKVANDARFKAKYIAGSRVYFNANTRPLYLRGVPATVMASSEAPNKPRLKSGELWIKVAVTARARRFSGAPCRVDVSQLVAYKSTGTSAPHGA